MNHDVANDEDVANHDESTITHNVHNNDDVAENDNVANNEVMMECRSGVFSCHSRVHMKLCDHRAFQDSNSIRRKPA